MKPNSQLTLTASVLFYIAISCAASGPAAFGPTPASARPAVLPAAPAPESDLALKDCEQDVLDSWAGSKLTTLLATMLMQCCHSTVLQKHGRLWAVSSLW